MLQTSIRYLYVYAFADKRKSNNCKALKSIKNIEIKRK